MSTQILLTVPDELYQQVEEVAGATQRNVADLLLDTIAHSFSPLPVDSNRVAMEENLATYAQLHAELVEQYLNHYVAIHQGALVDHDADPVLLLQRIRTNYPNQVVLRRKVEPVVEREITVRHPRLESSVHGQNER